MEASQVIDEVGKIVSENRYLKSMLNKVETTYIDADKFYNVALTTDVVAALHSVSSALVRKYIKLGMIAEHPMSSPSKLLVRGSDALMLDFKQMKRELKFKVSYERDSFAKN